VLFSAENLCDHYKVILRVIFRGTMSRELRDKADVMMKELSEMLKPLREEISKLRSAENASIQDSASKNRRV
jgi:hypothetical protein